MLDEVKQDAAIEETEPQEKNQEQIEVTKSNEKLENQNWLKHRLERAKEQGVKQVLSELGMDSLENAKEKFKMMENYENQINELDQQIKKSKNLEYKVEAMQSGFDTKFIDYIIHELHDKVTEKEDFSTLLTKFKIDNPQFLSNNVGIKFSTSPNFENTVQSKDISKRFNEIVQKRLQKD